MDLKNWDIFDNLQEEFIKKVKYFNVFQTDFRSFQKKAAFLITQDDDVYAIGSANSNYCLGTGSTNVCETPVIVKHLCKQKIKEFDCGYKHVLALTENGCIFGWGSNDCGQVGSGSQRAHDYHPTRVLGVEKEDIIKISAGTAHSLALNRKGQVFGWGDNNNGQVNNVSSENQNTAINIGLKADIVDIKCGCDFSLALSVDGKIYVWGSNEFGTLGIKPKEDCELSTFRTVYLPNNIPMTQIACGEFHVLALNEKGSMCAWGRNNYGQIGNGCRLMQATPKYILENVKQIACSFSTSAALLKDGISCIWGQCKINEGMVTNSEGIRSSPIGVDVSSLQEAILQYSSSPVTIKVVDVLNTGPLPSVQKMSYDSASSALSTLADAVDDESLSDLVIVVEGRKIHVHKLVLQLRSQYFRKMFECRWQEGKSGEILITPYSYDTYKRFIDFLYKGTLPATLEEALGMMDLAECYCEKELKHFCEMIINKIKINVENAVPIYDSAVKYDMKDMKESSFQFMFNNLSQIKNTDAFKTLTEHVKKDFMERVFGHLF